VRQIELTIVSSWVHVNFLYCIYFCEIEPAWLSAKGLNSHPGSSRHEKLHLDKTIHCSKEAFSLEMVIPSFNVPYVNAPSVKLKFKVQGAIFFMEHRWGDCLPFVGLEPTDG